jgi:hypothetical protein
LLLSGKEQKIQDLEKALADQREISGETFLRLTTSSSFFSRSMKNL